MEKAAKLQMQIRENSSELTDFLQDLTKWEENVKKEDEHLRTSRRIDEKLPPVRKGKNSATAKESQGQSAGTGDQNNNKNKKVAAPQVKKEKIKSYDYDAWSKFDVEAACADMDENESESDFDDEEDEEDEGEMERIEEQRKLQQAAMEKDKGNQFFKDGKYEAAINRYTTAINMDPNNPIFYANRGMALLKMERYGAAEQDCTFALELDPGYTKALLRRATTRMKLKKVKNALEDFHDVLKQEPGNKQATAEIKNIEKVMNMARESKKKARTEEPNNLTNIERQEKRKRRSTKPLKRIYIQEIGGSDEDEEQPETLGVKTPAHIKGDESTYKRVPPLHQAAAPPQPPQPPAAAAALTNEIVIDLAVPTTSFMFETELKRLKNNSYIFYKYLKMIPCDQYTKLFRQCIDSLLSLFLGALHVYYIREKHCVHEELENFCQVERFTMATMFLSKNDKKVITGLLDYIGSVEYPEQLTEERISSLRKKYK